ncbi:MAG: glycoside hydrolase family 3 N-terminal domain-containing protein, partial [bacterium]|nr:glycoside hydrolase family 3 N-terminal domain-containing protein [bacterium]
MLSKRKLLILLIVLLLLYFSFYFLVKEEKEIQIDILIFSPHPDDEVLCCGGTILKAVKEGKNVKVVFLTNGDAYTQSVSAWLEKQADEFAPEDYINLGKERQEEALRAAKKLGLEKNDLIFLSYPDNGLFNLWNNLYEGLYLSETTNTNSSPYELTYNLAKQGYTKENVILDIKDILEKYQPGKIYLPNILDTHRDHQASNEFVLSALNKLDLETNNDWLGSLGSFYYLVHDTGGILDEEFYSYASYSPYVFSREPNYEEDISDFRKEKNLALKEYYSQAITEEDAEFLNSFDKDVELFWDMPSNPQAYLRYIEQEWQNIGQVMKSQEYNVNFAPVVDVAQDIEDFDMPLTGKKRIYSEDPEIVAELAGAVIKGMNNGGIVPVIKHFPGLGRVSTDTHVWLSETEISKEDLYQREFIPFMNLIEKDYNFWIMIDHSIHLSLDEKPASLSYEVQTKLLREELGFKGIIIVDELLAMQAIREYAFRQNMEEPYIGEIISQVFAAGGDIALFYVPSSLEAKKVIEQTIKAVKEAIDKDEINQQIIDDSVARILAEKERIFGVPLVHLMKDMTLEEKIAQKLITDVYSGREEEEAGGWKEVLGEYNVGGIHARDQNLITEIQDQAKVPMFVTGQHEGGMVNQYGLNVYTHSAYMVGKEFEFLKKRAGAKISYNIKKEKEETEDFYESFDLGQRDEITRQNILNSLIDSVDELIVAYSDIEQKGYVSPNPNYISPLTIYHSVGGYEIKPFYDLPIFWLRKFSDQEVSFYAYVLFKEIFNDWEKDQGKLSTYTRDIILNLRSLKEEIKNRKSIIDDPKSKEEVRILFLATHPDDEDSEGLAYFKYKFNSETYILLVTRGEGGENEINVTYEDLGKMRTKEMERAAEILRVDKLYYLDLEDFGYCVL